MLARLPERARTPAMARAITSPSAFLLAGGGAAAAILAGAPLAAAAAVGGLAWAIRVALAVPKAPRTDRIEPGTLRNPWRKMVVEAQNSRAQFQRTVERTRPGPLRDRLGDLGRRLDDAVHESWRVACQGDNLERAIGQLDTRSAQAELQQARAEAEAAGGRPPASLARTIEALESQLSSAARLTSAWQEARDKLRLLNAQLDEAVARAVELSVRAGDASELSPLADDVNNLVSELESLRQGLETLDNPGAMGQSATSS